MLKFLKNNLYLKVFLMGFVMFILMLSPMLIYNKGIFLYYGDYVAQQIPFYQLAQEAVKNGNIFWNWNTDLGANFIGSYSFYLLGSPFFWLTIPFPSEITVYLMPILLALKYGTAAVTSYAYIKRFVKSNNIAVVGALLYAFSGFQAYNIFFNHFHDVVAFFPLLLLALELNVVDGRKGVFALTVGLMAMISYFFFFGQIIFLVIYFLMRCFCKDFKITFKKFLGLALEAVVGVMLAAFILLPSVLAITGNPRTDERLMGHDIIAYEDRFRIIRIIQSFFMIPDMPARPNLFYDDSAKWSSIAGFLPLFGMAGVIAFMSEFKKHWASRIIKICMVMAFVPILNSAFSAFTYSYYARWFYMPILIMAMMTAVSLERSFGISDSNTSHVRISKMRFNKGIKISAIIILVCMVIACLPSSRYGGKEFFWFSFPEQPLFFWISAGLGMVLLALLYWLINLTNPVDTSNLLKPKKSINSDELKHVGNESMDTLSIDSLSMESISMDASDIDMLSVPEEVDGVIPKNLEVAHNQPITKKSFWTNIVSNVFKFVSVKYCPVTGKPFGDITKRAVITTVAACVICTGIVIAYGVWMSPYPNEYINEAINGKENINLPKTEGEFYRIDISEDKDNYSMSWGIPNMRAFQSIVPASIMEFYPTVDVERNVASRADISHYSLRGLFSVKYYFNHHDEILEEDKDKEKKLGIQGFEYYNTQNNFDVYENKFFIPMGFTYDNYITKEQYEKIDNKATRERLLLKAIVLERADESKYSKYMEKIKDEHTSIPVDYEQECANRKASSAYYFAEDSNRFTAKIDMDHDNLVFFSVPFDKGFKATVDAEPVTVIKTNIGFMAVEVPKGDHTIIFEYMPVGLKVGVIMTILASLILIIYVMLYLKSKKTAKSKL